MNIWIIDHYAVPEKYYPLIRQTIFAKKLIQKGYSVRIFSASTVHNSDINLIDDSALFREELIDDVLYTYINCRNYKGNGLRRIYNMLEFARKLPKVCDYYSKKEGYPDIVLSCSMTLHACQEGIKLAHKYGAKGVAQITDLWPESLVCYWGLHKYNPIIIYLRRIEKWIYVHSDKIVFSMEGGYDYIKEQKWEKSVPLSKVHFINNGVDIPRFNFNKENYRIQDSDLENNSIFKVIYVGSVRKVNNLGLLLDAAKQIKNNTVKVLIWGDGDEIETLKKRVLEEKIGNVVFKGRVEKKYIPYIISCADLNIAHNNPSDIFRFGISFNKIFDYMAAGKPILSDFPCKYNPAIMFDSGTEVVDPTPEKIALEIERYAVMDSEKYNLYSKNALKAAECYDFEILVNSLIDVFKK